MSRFAKIFQTYKKQFAALFVLVFGLSFAPFYPAHAGTIWDIGTTVASSMSGVIAAALNAVLYLIGQVLGVALAAIGSFADYAMQPQPITTDPTMKEAWAITRDFANMFFILILLGIALDFILFNSFRVKQMIPRLILVALLINFSLPLAGVVIDFANVFTTFFLSQVTDNNHGFTVVIADKLSLASIFTNDTQGVIDGLQVQNRVFINMLFIILFMFGTAFVFLVLALMFLVRTGYLYVLLVALPLVLVLSAFPPTSGHFRSWTNSFIKWVMFAPIATFFLWFATIMADKLITDSTKIGINDTDFAGSFYKYVIVWVFLVGALTAASSMGGKASGIAMGLATSIKGKTLQGLKRGGSAGLAAAGRRTKADEGMEWAANKLQGYGLDSFAGGIRSVGAKTKMAIAKREELNSQKKAELDSLSDSALASEQERYEKSPIPGSGAAAAYIAATRARKGKLKVLDPSGALDVAKTETLVRNSYETARKHKNKVAMDSILQSNPLIAKKIRQEEWDKDEREGKLITATDEKTGKLTKRNRQTGQSLADVERNVFDISRAELKNLKGQWDEKSVGEFIESGHLSKSHIKEATESDPDFITLIRKYYENIDSMSGNDKAAAIERATKLNPTLTNTYVSGNLADVGLGKPKNTDDWDSGQNKKNQQNQNKNQKTPWHLQS